MDLLVHYVPTLRVAHFVDLRGIRPLRGLLPLRFNDAGVDTQARMSTHDWSKSYFVEEYNLGLLVSTTEYRDGKKVE